MWGEEDVGGGKKGDEEGKNKIRKKGVGGKEGGKEDMGGGKKGDKEGGRKGRTR